MNYKDLDISDGGAASRLFAGIAAGKTTGKEKDEILKGLRQYCGQDTLAMVKLVDVILVRIKFESRP